MWFPNVRSCDWSTWRAVSVERRQWTADCGRQTADWGYNDCNEDWGKCMPGGLINRSMEVIFRWYERHKKCWYCVTSLSLGYTSLLRYLTISWEVSCGSRAGGATRWSFVESPVKILTVVLSKTTQRLAVEITVHWNTKQDTFLNQESAGLSRML